MDTRKAYGILSAVGTRLGERARDEPDLVAQIRQAPDLGTLREVVAHQAQGLVPPALLEAFLHEILGEADWRQWRARLLLQVKMVREGGKPAPGHEAGRGVGRP